jgi:thiamine transport system substrate-binding protein
MTHDSFALADSVMEAFTQQTGYGVQVLHAGDAGAMVNQAILSKDHPLGDVLFGVDNTFLSRALGAGIFEPYESAAASGVDSAFELDPQHRVTPIDYGDVCPVFDEKAFATATPAAPTSLDSLADPDYTGMLVTENPATSSPGLAFMLATIAKYGESASGGWLDYWSKLRANDVLVSQSWDDAYDSRFSAGPGGGDRPIVVSYATDPAADVIFADPPKDKPSVGVMLDACFRQVEFAGVLTGAANPDGARAFIDFLLSPLAQEDIPSEMYVFPAVSGTTLPNAFKQWAQVAPNPLTLDPAQIEQKREQWINEWTDTVVR